MKHIRLFLATGIAAAVLATPAIGAEDAGNESGERTVTLRYKFQPGETVRWDVVHRARVKTQIAGNSQTAETVSKSVKAWRVGDVKPDGTATFEHMVENVDMWQKLTGRDEVRYNSQTDAEPPAAFKNVAASVGTPIMTVTMDATGEVISRSGKSKAQTVENEGHITIPLPKEPIAVRA